MMHQDSLEPAAIQFTLERLQESTRQSGYFLPAVFMYLYPQEEQDKMPFTREDMKAIVQ